MALNALDLIFDEDNIVWEDEEGTRRKRFQERNNYFEDYDDIDFVTRFRLTKPTALSVLERIEERLEFPSFEKNDSISPINQLLMALRYYATGSTQLSSGDYGGFSKLTAHRIVHRVSAALAELSHTEIRFPETQQEILNTKHDFYNISGFPRVIGALDCTHIKIISPGGNHAELFRNRKGYFSINCQCICNPQLEITDLVARWPGGAHDATIFSQSYRKNMFELGTFGNSVLVADRGYSSTPYMMLPLSNVTTEAERLYNESQIRTRNVIERLNGVWKKRFPVLALGIRVKLQRALTVIVASAVLHTIAVKAGEELPPDDAELVLPAPWEVLLQMGEMDDQALVEDVNPNRNRNRTDLARVHLTTNYFQTLLERHQQLMD